MLLKTIYEYLFKSKPRIVADTLQFALRETLWNPDEDGPQSGFKSEYTCNAVEKLHHQGRITAYANKLTREFIRTLISPYTTFEGHVRDNPKDFPKLSRFKTTRKEMQQGRIRWVKNLIEQLRDDM